VRNRPDDSVEVVAEGERNKLEKLLGLLREGPPAARVREVDADWSDYTGSYSGFSVRY
jgi:acylphosphatase